MRFEYQGTTYLIEFERQHRVIKWTDDIGNVTKRFDSKYPYTTARLLKLVGGVGRELVREYTVGCHPGDRFSFDGGRKAALTLALYDAPIEKSNGSGVSQLGLQLDKDFRTAVWNAYHNRKA